MGAINLRGGIYREIRVDLHRDRLRSTGLTALDVQTALSRDNVTLPGGYRMIFTGMKVLKDDGSRHHGLGIQPTVPVARTIAGVTQGKDELLQEAIEVVEGKK